MMVRPLVPDFVGLARLVSLLASRMCCVSLGKSPNKYSDVSGIVVVLHWAAQSLWMPFFIDRSLGLIKSCRQCLFRLVKSSLLFFLFCFYTMSVTSLMATKDATFEFCVFWYLKSCVGTVVGSWFPVGGLILNVLKPSMFAGLGYWSTFSCVFSSCILSFRRLFTILASSSSTERPVFSLGLSLGR